MFKENIISLPWTIIKMQIYKEYLNHTFGLTLSTPGLVSSFLSKFKDVRTISTYPPLAYDKSKPTLLTKL